MSFCIGFDDTIVRNQPAAVIIKHRLIFANHFNPSIRE